MSRCLAESLSLAAALAGFYGLDRAVAPFQEHAFAIRLVHQGQSVAILPEAGVALDEGGLRHPEKAGNHGDVLVMHFHEPRPAAASRAALAFVMDGGRHRTEA